MVDAVEQRSGGNHKVLAKKLANSLLGEFSPSLPLPFHPHVSYAISFSPHFVAFLLALPLTTYTHTHIYGVLVHLAYINWWCPYKVITTLYTALSQGCDKLVTSTCARQAAHIPLLMRANKLETALSRDRLYSLSGPTRYVFFMYIFTAKLGGYFDHQVWLPQLHYILHVSKLYMTQYIMC